MQLQLRFLVTLQLIGLLPQRLKAIFIALGVLMVVAFGAYTKSLGRPLMFVLILIMMPLATTEIGTDGWISASWECWSPSMAAGSSSTRRSS